LEYLKAHLFDVPNNMHLCLLGSVIC